MSIPEPIDPELAETLKRAFDGSSFNRLLGIHTEEIRRGYACMRLPHRPEILQAAGLVHGGAIATLIDSAAALAIFSGLPHRPRRMATIDFHIHYLEGVEDEDLLAEARVRRRGRSVAFVSADVVSASGKEAAHGELAFRVVL